MRTPRTRAGWLGGAVAAAAIAMALGPGIYSQTHPAALQTTAKTATAAINCPPSAAVATSGGSGPGC